MTEFDAGDESETAQARQEMLARLAVEVTEDPGADCFPRYAELLRSSGRAVEARRVAEAGLAAAPENNAGELALALALIDLGEFDVAKQKLAKLLEREVGDYQWSATPLAPLPGMGASADDESLDGLGDAELDDAFEQAESQPEEMMDVNRVAEEAMRMESLDEPEPIFSAEALPTFATETMAGVLEAQGDLEGADSIRSALVEEAHELVESDVEPTWGEVDAAESVPELATPMFDSGASHASDHDERQRIIATLETWLENLQGSAA